MLREASVRFLSMPDEITSVVPFNSSAEMTPMKSFVFGEDNFKSSTTTTSPALRRSLKAFRNARERVFLETFFEKSRGFGPKTTPPPAHNGERNEPARARPVPFCFHGFLLEPWTSPTVLVQAVPLRCAALCATTVSWTACVPFPFSISANFTSSSPEFFPARFLMAIFMARYFLAAAGAAAGLASAFLSAPPFFLIETLTGGFQPFGRFLDSRMMT